MSYIVQKYGGTSIGQADRMLQVADIVKESLEGNKVVVVLSAMSSYIKAEGTTSRLIEATNAAINKGPYHKILDLLEESHCRAIEEAIGDLKIQSQLKEEVTRELKHLKSFLDAIQIIGELSPRSHDVVIGVGEKLSARIFAGILNSQGIDAEYINLENLIDRDFTELNHEFYAYLTERLAKIIKNCGTKVPVVTGYFGFVPEGIIKSIGRGYTDFTAALISAGIKARELQIWKEVDGIFSADPRKVPTANVLPDITPDEAAELTYFGSEVIHPFTMEQVIKANIPIRIKNTFRPDYPGTIIDPNKTFHKSFKKAAAVTVKRDVTVINITSNRMLMAYGFMAKVFNILAKHGIVIDQIATSEVNISLTLPQSQSYEAAIPELEKIGTVQVNKGMAIISLIGKVMKRSIGLAGRMFSILAESNVNIEMITQGASEINISCVVQDEDADVALRSIHQGLLE